MISGELVFLALVALLMAPVVLVGFAMAGYVAFSLVMRVIDDLRTCRPTRTNR